MAREYLYATKYSTTQVIAKAYKEYCTEAAEKYATLIEIANRVVDDVSDDTVDVNETVNSIIASYADRGINKFDNIILLDAPYSLADLFQSLGRAVKSDMSKIQNGESLSELPNINTIDVTGMSKTMNITELFSQMNAAYHAITVEQAVASAYDIGGSINDKISCVRDVISDKFSNAYVDVSNTLSNALDKIRSGANIIDYVKQRVSTGGLNAIANDSIDNIGQSEDVTFTGASPVSALSTLAAGKQVLAGAAKAMKIVANTTITILSGIYNLGKKLITRVAKKVYQTTVNPYDMRLVSDNGNNTINDYYYRHVVSLAGYPYVSSKLSEGPIHFDFTPCEVILQARKANIIYPVYTNITSAFEGLMLNELGVQLNAGPGLLDGINASMRANYADLYKAANDMFSLTLTPGVDNLLDSLNGYAQSISGKVTTAEELIKIKPIKSDVLFNRNTNSLRITETAKHAESTGELIGFYYSTAELNEILSQVTDTNAYTSVDRSEQDFYSDFITGAVLTAALMNILRVESTGESIATDSTIMTDAALSSIFTGLPSIVKNADFFKLVTDLVCRINSAGENVYASLTMPKSGFVSTLNNVFSYRNDHPFDFTFWPYSRNYVDWFAGSFEIVSDAENADSFTNFLTMTIVIALVATIAITAGVALKRAFVRSQVDLMGKEWNLTDLASKGEDTTLALKQYKKAKRKSNFLGTLTGNLTQATASGLSNISSDNVVDLSPIINLIK